MHLDAETLERVLHGEVGPERAFAVRDHLSGCSGCSSTLEDARRREARIFRLFDELDVPLPTGVPLEPPASVDRPWARIAAGVALLVAAGGALTLPGSPVRTWLEERQAEREEVGRRDTVPPAADIPPASGITVVPAGPFRVVFLSSQEAGAVRVRLSGEPDVEIRVIGEPVPLESGPDRLRVANRGSRASYDVRLPTAGPRVEIRVEDRTILLVAEGRVTTDAPAEGAGWTFELTPP